MSTQAPMIHIFSLTPLTSPHYPSRLTHCFTKDTYVHISEQPNSVTPLRPVLCKCWTTGFSVSSLVLREACPGNTSIQLALYRYLLLARRISKYLLRFFPFCLHHQTSHLVSCRVHGRCCFFVVSKLPHHGKVNFERGAKRQVLRPTVCESFDV